MGAIKLLIANVFEDGIGGGRSVDDGEKCDAALAEYDQMTRELESWRSLRVGYVTRDAVQEALKAARDALLAVQDYTEGGGEVYPQKKWNKAIGLIEPLLEDE